MIFRDLFLLKLLVPSPDWFVGISGLELCLPNCNWITNKTINLYPWDAGIKSGVTYNVFYPNNINMLYLLLVIVYGSEIEFLIFNYLKLSVIISI